LGASTNTTSPFLLKPKRMHWRTYQRLCNELEEADRHSWPDWLLKRIAAL
jgi:hypothetical protein